MGEIFGELKRPPSPRDETGRFTSGPTENCTGAEYREEEKFKTDVAKEAGISLDTAERYTRLAGPPQHRQAVKAATEEYFAAKRQKTQLPTAKGLLKVVEKASGVEAAPLLRPQPAPSRHFLALLKDFRDHSDNYDARAFAGDEKLVELYQKVGTQFHSFLQSFEVEAESTIITNC